MALAAPSQLSCLLALLLGLRCALARIGEVTVLDESSFDSFVKANDKVIIDFFDAPSKNEGAISQAFRRAKTLGCGAKFATVDADHQKALAQKFVPAGGFPQLMWFRNGEPTQYHRTLREPEEIVQFALAVDRELIQDIKDEKEAMSYNRAVIVKTTKGSNLYKMAETIASKHMDTMAWFLLTGSDGKDSLEAKYRDREAGWRVVTQEFTEAHTVENLDSWARHLVIRSEPIPEYNDGDAKLIVSDNFEAHVFTPDKDVFLMVFAPWCGFSKKAMPVWDELARKVSALSTVAVFKMDGSKNDSPVPEYFRWTAYPTFFFLKAGTKQPFFYKGPRSADNFIEFARQNGATIDLNAAAEDPDSADL